MGNFPVRSVLVVNAVFFDDQREIDLVIGQGRVGLIIDKFF